MDTNRQPGDGLLQRFAEVGVAAGVGTNNISIVDAAKGAEFPPQAQPAPNATPAWCWAYWVGIGLAFLFEHLDDTFRKPEDLRSCWVCRCWA